jgi:hypothetical protein
VDTVPGESRNNSAFHIAGFYAPVKGAIRDLLFYGYDAHPSHRIWQFLPAIETANVVESATIAVWPGCVTMHTIKHVSQNPFDPLHGDTFAEACLTVEFVKFRV